MFGDIDAKDIEIGLVDLDLEAVVEEAEHLKLLSLFEIRRLQVADPLEGLIGIGVNPDMFKKYLVALRVGLPIIGDHAPGEIEGEPLPIGHHLSNMGALDVLANDNSFL